MTGAPDPQAVALAAQLEHADPRTRSDAAAGLAALAAARHALLPHGSPGGGQPPACADIVSRLAGRIPVEPDPTARHALLRALTAVGCAEVVGQTLPYLRSESAAIRTAVIDALSQVAATEAVIEGLLDDRDADIRVRAVTLLGQMHSRSGVGWLHALVRSDSDPRVVGSAVGELMARDDVPQAQLAAVCAEAARRFPADPYLRFLHDTVAEAVDGVVR